MTTFQDMVNNLYPKFKYDRREIFKLNDGGKIAIDFKGALFKNKKSVNPILFIIPGLSSSSESKYIINLVKTARNLKYEVCVLNYRGIGNIDMGTPALYDAYSNKDFSEAMKAIHLRYCRNGRKALAVGCSLGANILANIIGLWGDNCILEAAVCVQPPMKMWELVPAIKHNCYGIYNKAMGANLVTDMFSKHKSIMQPVLKRLNMDIDEIIKNSLTFIEYNE